MCRGRVNMNFSLFNLCVCVNFGISVFYFVLFRFVPFLFCHKSRSYSFSEQPNPLYVFAMHVCSLFGILVFASYNVFSVHLIIQIGDTTSTNTELYAKIKKK